MNKLETKGAEVVMDKNTEVISSIDRALDIILLFYKEKRELGIGEISRALGVYKSTVHRTLSTLENKGFVTQIEENGKYWLGMKLYSIGMVTWENNKLNKIVAPYAKELSSKFSETVTVSILEGAVGLPHTTVIYKEEVLTNRLRTSHEVGGTYPINTTAVGKAILAYSEVELLNRLKEVNLTKNTENSISTFSELMEELEHIRKIGYSVDDEEEEVGLKCVAAPIFDGANKVVASISVSGPSGRMDLLEIESIGKLVVDTAKMISNKLK